MHTLRAELQEQQQNQYHNVELHHAKGRRWITINKMIQQQKGQAVMRVRKKKGDKDTTQAVERNRHN